MKRRQFIKATVVTTAAIASGVSLAEPGLREASFNGAKFLMHDIKADPFLKNWGKIIAVDKKPGETDEDFRSRIVAKITSRPK